MIRIVSWNIQYGKGNDGQVRLDRILEVLQEGAADVICLQEISRHDPALEGADQLQQLQAAFPEHQVFWGPSWERPGATPDRPCSFGNAILTSLPWTQVLRHQLPQPADAQAYSMPRQAVELFLQGTPGLRILTTHLEFFSARQQLAQAVALNLRQQEARLQARNPSPSKPGTPFSGLDVPERAVICGDFNFEPRSAAYGRLTDPDDAGDPVWQDAWGLCFPERKHDPTCGVFPDPQWPQGPHCRDFFFLSGLKASEVVNLEVDLATDASDHQPIWLELDL